MSVIMLFCALFDILKFVILNAIMLNIVTPLKKLNTIQNVLLRLG
jgi:hypothetical protein